MSGLYDKNGVVKERLQDMLDIATDFYSNLYNRDTADPGRASLMQFFLANVEPIHLEPGCDIDFLLCKDFTLEEIWDAIISFVSGKSPGPDGLTIEFYKTCFSVIKYKLLAFFNKIKNFDFVPSKVKAGLITLIPKGSASYDISKYRGITLNNVDLKIYTKMLHFRLTPFLENCIDESQFAKKGNKNVGTKLCDQRLIYGNGS